jgi:FAD/FMN-containing dehydrogenase
MATTPHRTVAKTAAERCFMNDDIPEAAFRPIEEAFGSRFTRHAPDEAESVAGQDLGSVFPESIEEVEFLTKLAVDYCIPLAARGAGTALYRGEAPPALLVRFDAMRGIRLPEESEEEDWVEVEPGVI